ncbi:pentatricopeptide repeat-containing protein At2g22070-like [Zingiber officinale]|uniref:Pentatricopeptide repeat-containing protein n=1 Tax=Zingiber officinale TaxID=94328 RepID=A0A8J5G7L5_ZINOF|nr:pentatricopeptide repeat-containing protein At2g22070-like [Zingiber officinale]KAG6497434.1 hypothetical protein ZIOFF_045334 [Zingiber officinale]
MLQRQILIAAKRTGSYNFASASLPLPGDLPSSPRHFASLLVFSAFLPSPHPPLRSPTDYPTTAFVHLLKASSRTVNSLLEAQSLHSVALKAALGHDDRVRLGLLNLYAKCGFLDTARKLFDEMRNRDVLSWTILISSYSRVGKFEEGINVFAEMLADGVPPNCVTLSSVLKCSVGFGDLQKGKSVHGWALRNGIEFDVVLQNSILDLYAKCGTLDCTKNVFRLMSEKDVISWNIMISTYLRDGDVERGMELFMHSPNQDVSSWNTVINGQMEHGFGVRALQILHNMVEKGPSFDHFTFTTALVLANRLTMLNLGKELHCRILRVGYNESAFIRTALSDMYAKCGDLEALPFIFNSTSEFVVGSVAESISWSVRVAGYVKNGMHEEAFKFLCKMFQLGVKVDQFSLTTIAAACSDARILEQGKQVHCCVEKLGYGYDVFLASAITDMYAKCGNLEDSRKVFDSFVNRNVVLWSSLIGAYASYGQAAEAIQLFEKMLEEKIIPNEISFVHVLSACAHEGLVEKGWDYFKSMQQEYGVVPSIEHFACMVDLLARAGFLKEAVSFIHENSISNHPVVLKALLSACRIHNNITLGMWVSEQLLQLEPCDHEHYVLLSNMYALEKRWEDASKVRTIMLERGIKKLPGQSWI